VRCRFSYMASKNCSRVQVGAFCAACASFSWSSLMLSTCMMMAGGIGSPASSLRSREDRPVSNYRSRKTLARTHTHTHARTHARTHAHTHEVH
jgi:hypothetical protein